MREAPRVSVVVPVYNPGRWIEPGIASILGQTLPAGQVEVVFVDDGSTDGTGERLDRLAAEHPATVRVIHIPPSGAPGRPRNVGIEAARGDYLQFLDADDELARDALERLVDMADRNRSDIVVEKFASASLRRSQRLFQRNVERTTLAETPTLIDSSLALAKLFRTSFVRDHALSFPEGWRLMEDQWFVLGAYARARSISVLADHACYFFHRRDDGGHLTTDVLDPEAQVANLRALVDKVEGDVEPGPIRDRILRRLVRAELLARVGEPAYQAMSEDARTRLFSGFRDLLRERIDESVIAELGAVGRIRAELLLRDRPAELLALAERMLDVDLATRLQRAGWRDGRLDIRALAGLRFTAAARPLVVRRYQDTTRLDPALADELLGAPIDVRAELGGLRVEYILRTRSTSLEWHVRGRIEPRPAGRGPASHPVGAATTVVIDPLGVGPVAVALAEGTWDLFLRLSAFGFERTVPLGVNRAQGVDAACRPALLGDPVRVVVPVVDPSGLRLEVDPPGEALTGALVRRPIRVVRDGDRVTIALAMVAGPGAAPLPVELVIGMPTGERAIAGELHGWLDGVVVDARPEGLTGLPVGPHPFALRVLGADLALGTVRIEGPSRLHVDGLPRLTTAGRAAEVARWPLATLGSSGGAWLAAGRRFVRRKVVSIQQRLGRPG